MKIAKRRHSTNQTARLQSPDGHLRRLVGGLWLIGGITIRVRCREFNAHVNSRGPRIQHARLLIARIVFSKESRYDIYDLR